MTRQYAGDRRRAEFTREQLTQFPGREVTALVDLGEVDERVIGTLGPALWRTIDLTRKHRHGNGDRDVRCLLLRSVEVVVVILPVELRGAWLAS